MYYNSKEYIECARGATMRFHDGGFYVYYEKENPFIAVECGTLTYQEKRDRLK
ncbi:MAG: hypothetical protein ACRCTZ_18600 [Sarcina sp.]